MESRILTLRRDLQLAIENSNCKLTEEESIRKRNLIQERIVTSVENIHPYCKSILKTFFFRNPNIESLELFGSFKSGNYVLNEYDENYPLRLKEGTLNKYRIVSDVDILLPLGTPYKEVEGTDVKFNFRPYSGTIKVNKKDII